MARRKSGQGTVRLRKDGRWEGRIVIGYDENGLPKTKNVTAKKSAPKNITKAIKKPDAAPNIRAPLNILYELLYSLLTHFAATNLDTANGKL